MVAVAVDMRRGIGNAEDAARVFSAQSGNAIVNLDRIWSAWERLHDDCAYSVRIQRGHQLSLTDRRLIDAAISKVAVRIDGNQVDSSFSALLLGQPRVQRRCPVARVRATDAPCSHRGTVRSLPLELARARPVRS